MQEVASWSKLVGCGNKMRVEEGKGVRLRGEKRHGAYGCFVKEGVVDCGNKKGVEGCGNNA